MNRTREDFCRALLEDYPCEALDPERLATRFVRYFEVPARPTIEQLKALLKRTGFGEVSGTRHIDAKGIHFSAPGGGYDIHYREDLWEGTRDYSVVHETYEIIHETLCDMHSGSQPDRDVCTQAERFAAAVLMQPRAFEPLALEWGLDVLRLHKAFRCSYAAVTIRLAEVLRQPPLMAILYARPDGRNPRDRADHSDLRAIVVRRTRGFGTPRGFPICGDRGGIPRRGRLIPDGSLAEQAARYGTARYAQDGGYAAIARPVIRKGELARVVVIAVPESFSAVLGPQMVASDMPGRRRRPMPAMAAVGPW
ncbi:MAG: ImmA/IrrE family metallo-endopeptidase [Dehalococcoidia bacterium]|nr:ImmA/IrrE family metallo-endopeptidase [Dehalococcoidia bacterium]